MNQHTPSFTGRGFARRDFLKSALTAVAASAAPNIITSFSLFGAEGKPTPNDTINLGFIGVGKRAFPTLMPYFLGLPGTRVLAVCDVDPLRRDLARDRVKAFYAEQSPSGTAAACDAYTDFREILTRKDIDAVVIAVPDHWHVPLSLRAMRAGKDVYCEKPETLSVAEGRVLVDFCAKSDRIYSGGSQILIQRGYFPKQVIKSGQLGKVKTVMVADFPKFWGMREPNLNAKDPVPEGMNWDLWLGPAPNLPFSSQYHHHKNPEEAAFNPWAKFRPFGGGHLGDWGGHLIGPILWACDLDHTGPVEVTAYPDRPMPPDNVEPILEYTFADGMKILHQKFDPNICGDQHYYIGENGDLSKEGRKKLDPEKIKAVEVLDYKGQGMPPDDFLHCVRTRNKKTFRNPESCHRVCTALHLGNISYVLKGRTIKFDPVREQIVGDDEANALLARQFREPWGLNV